MKNWNWAKSRKLEGTTIFLFFLSICFFYPGFFSEDSIAQLTEARSGVYSDGHPPIMAFIWRYLDSIYPGQLGMLLLQLSLYWSGLFFIAKYSNLSESKRLNFLLFAGLFPGTLGILGTIWKDVLMMAFGVFGIGLGLRALSQRSWPCLIFSVCSLFLACSMRQNGIFVLPPLLLGLLFSFSGRRRVVSIVVTLLATAIFLIGNSFFTYDVLGAKKTHLWRLLPLFDLAGIYYHLGRIPEKTSVPFATDSFNLENLNSQYSPRSLMPLVLPLCQPLPTSCDPPPFFDINLKTDVEVGKQLQDLRSKWLKEVMEHPLEYFLHRIKAFSHLLGIHGQLWAPVYFTQVKNDVGLEAEPNSFQVGFARLLRKLTQFGFFSAWVILLVNIFLALKLRKSPESKEKPFVVGIVASAFLFEFAYLVITPSMDYRYSYWFIVATAIAYFLYLFRHQELPQ